MSTTLGGVRGLFFGNFSRMASSIPAQAPSMSGIATVGLKSASLVMPFALLLYLYNIRSRPGPIVKTPNGVLQGVASVSRDGNTFYEFLGIPYALPPIGDLRFEPPHPPRNWEGTRMATDYGPKCMQIEFYTAKLMGQEDCLYLNVFTPKLPEDSNEELMPVMVFIHGGYFMSGSSNTYGPSYFMEKGLNTVILTINYRLSSLGFLNTGDGVVRGNMGMKDQVMALRWVQENIEYFGGDRSRVTIFGNSAGGSAVHFHTLSPMSKGLFSKAISQSGSAIKPFSFVSTPRIQAMILGERVNCPTNDSITLVSCLKGMDGNRIIMANSDYLNVFLEPLAMFAPSIEAIDDDNTFLSKHPYDILTSGEQHDVPFMTGLNSDEGLLFTARILKNKALIDQIDEHLEEVAPKLLAYSQDARKDEITATVRKFYLGDPSLIGFLWSFQNFTDMISDRLYFTASREAAMLHSRNSPTYLYYYTYPATFSISNILSFSGKLPPVLELMFNLATKWVQHTILGRNSTRLGVCHGDENLVLFDMGYMFNVKKGDTDYETSEAMVKLWTDFAAAPYGSELKFGDAVWKPLERTNTIPKYLKIDTKPEIIQEPFTERIEFWKKLFQFTN